jgi:glucose/arabinose dehydrogenase
MHRSSFGVRVAAVASVVALTVVLALPAGAQTPQERAGDLVGSLIGPGARLTLVGEFNKPVLVTAPPGDQTFYIVAEKDGRILSFVGGQQQTAPFLDLTGQVGLGDVGGLLSVAFAPDWATSGKVYVHSTKVGSEDNLVVEYTRSPTNPYAVNPSSARVLFNILQPNHNHPGGGMTFGTDGMLYIAIGDGGAGFTSVVPDPDNNAQRLDTLKGKVLRVRPTPGGPAPYTIPADNPYVGVPGASGEIWHWGFRNPWRIAFNHGNGDLFIADPGDNSKEEVDHAPVGSKGTNFGWSCYEGTAPIVPSRCSDGRPLQFPAYEYNYGPQGRCAIIGGVVSRDPRVRRTAGRYLFGDFCSGEIFSLQVIGATVNVRPETFGVPGKKVRFMSSFGEDGLNRVYVMSMGSGELYRIDPCIIGVICGLPPLPVVG